MTFPSQIGRKAFAGSLLIATEATPATVWGFANASIALSQTDNVGRPQVVDGVTQPHIESPGVTLGRLQFSAFLTPDRDVAGFLNTNFGPRTAGQLPVCIANIKPYGGASVLKAGGIWWERVTVAGQFSEQGTAAMVRLQASARILDFDNFYAAATLTAPTTVGKNGAGASSFVRASLTNSAASPTTYGNLRSFSLVLDNSLTLDPGTTDATHRIAEGCTPGPLMGACTFEQMWSAANPVPNIYQSGGYPFTLALPSGDGAHALAIDISASRDGFGYSLLPTEYLSRGIAFSLFGSQTSPNTTGAADGGAGFPFVASYS